MTKLNFIPDSEWTSFCNQKGVAPINRAFFDGTDINCKASARTDRKLLLHEVGHFMKLPDHIHPQLPPKPSFGDYLKATGAYLGHAKTVGFDVRAGTSALRLKGPQHGQEAALQKLLGDQGTHG